MLTECQIDTSLGVMSKLRIMPPEQLREIRKELQMTQLQMAGRMNVTRLTYIRWETGATKISGPAVILAEILLAKHRGASESSV